MHTLQNHPLGSLEKICIWLQLAGWKARTKSSALKFYGRVMSKSAWSAICQRRSQRPYFQPWRNTGRAGQRGHLCNTTPCPRRGRPGRIAGELSAFHVQVQEAWTRPVRDDRRAVTCVRNGDPQETRWRESRREGKKRRRDPPPTPVSLHQSVPVVAAGAPTHLSPVCAHLRPARGQHGVAAGGWRASRGRWAPRGLGAPCLLSKGTHRRARGGRTAETPPLQLQKI